MAANGRRPIRHNRVLAPISFFMGWFATELSWPFIVLNTIRSAVAVRRGAHRTAEGRAALAAQAVATASGISFIVEGRRTTEQFEAALAPYLSQEDLAARPSSMRLGEWLPVLYGGRGRRMRTRDVRFPTHDGGSLRLDVYSPTTGAEPGAKLPVVIQVHGGGWVIGDKREQGVPLLNHLAANGWVGFNVNYRLSPAVKSPAHLIDVKSAIAWVREHADEYGGDPDFICITGGSAGGHLVAMAALTQNDPEYQPGFEDRDTSVQAAVPIYGVYDLVDEAGNMMPGFRDTFIAPVVVGRKYAADPEAFERYSPLYRTSAAAPPMMMVAGSRDALVPIEASRPFARRLAEVSEHAVIWVELLGAQHAYEIFPSPRTVRAVEFVERFLDGVRRGVIK